MPLSRSADWKLSLRFAKNFLFLLCIFSAFAATTGIQKAVEAWAEADANIAGTLLHGLGQSTQMKASTVATGQFAITILPACTAGELVWILMAAICAFPTTIARKFIGVAFATSAIAALNIFRIVSVFIIGVYRNDWFYVVHEEIWSGLNVLAVTAIVMAWILWAYGPHKRAVMATDLISRKKVIGFYVRFAFCFSIGFAASWLGLADRCEAAFRAVETSISSSATGVREIDFERLSSSDTRIVIVNRALMNPDGSGPVRNLDVDTRCAVWLPSCVFIALVLAGPPSWRLRVWSLAFGLLALLGLLLLIIEFAIWNNSTEVELVVLSHFWKCAAEGIQVDLQAFSYVGAPVLLWTLLGFRRANFICENDANGVQTAGYGH